MRLATLSVLAALTAGVLIAGCAAGPATAPATNPGAATTATPSGSGSAGLGGSGQLLGGDPGATRKELAGLTSGWIESYARSDADGGKAVSDYSAEHTSDRFQKEWESGDMAYVMRSFAVTGVKGDARTAKVTVRFDITSLREPVTTPGGQPTYEPAPPFDVTYTWIKTPKGWQLDEITKTSDGSFFGAPVVYGK